MDNADKGIDRKNGREWLILLLSILSALIIWLMHNLSMTYSVFLEYKVDVVTSLEGRSKNSTSEEVLIIRGKADGYYIIAQRLGRNNRITINVRPEDLIQREKDGDYFYLNAKDVTSAVVAALDEHVELEFIVTEKLDFLIHKMQFKRVPVVPKTFIECSSQYMPIGEITLKPDSIDIYGEVRYINAIDSVWTEALFETGVDAPLNGILNIIPQRMVQYSTDNIYYTLDIARYVEETMEVNIQASGLPSGKEMIILPSVVNVTYRRFFGGEGFTSKDLNFTIDYQEYLNSINSRVVPTLDSVPKGIIKYEISPRYVDCIVVDI